jgi:hypothetical protein
MLNMRLIIEAVIGKILKIGSRVVSIIKNQLIAISKCNTKKILITFNMIFLRFSPNCFWTHKIQFV